MSVAKLTMFAQIIARGKSVSLLPQFTNRLASSWSPRLPAAALAQTKSGCVIRRAASGTPAGLHTKVDSDLVTFLQGEVEAEKKQHKPPKSGPGIPGFEITTQGSVITLTKKFKDETITIKCSVNATVSTDDGIEASDHEGQQEEPPMIMPDMTARPDFMVKISKPNGRILAFTCRLFGPSEISPDQPDSDKFELEGFGVVNAEDVDEDGDLDANVYFGDAGIIDGQLYDLLMNYLDSRGIGNEFADNLVDYATWYEHSRYIDLLDRIKSFLNGK